MSCQQSPTLSSAESDSQEEQESLDLQTLCRYRELRNGGPSPARLRPVGARHRFQEVGGCHIRVLKSHRHSEDDTVCERFVDMHYLGAKVRSITTWFGVICKTKSLRCA